MAKFNFFKKEYRKVKNHEGDRAYRPGSRMELYNLAATSFVEDRFYESAGRQLARLKKILVQVDPAFACKLAVYARKSMHLRSIPIVLLMELVKLHRKKKIDKRFIGKAITSVISRADEITEILAYYQAANQRSGAKKLNRLSRQVKNGVAGAFNKFDEYQFAKYNRKGDVTLKDALFLTHPKAKDETQQMLFDKIAADKLETPYTWETELSTRGNTKDVWMELLDSGKLGYMALMRNLRNLLNAGLPYKYLEKAAQRIADEKQVRKSKQLPFRFFAAYKGISGLADASVFLEALEQAVAHSVDNISFFKGRRVLIASDVSGSMMRPLSQRSSIQCYDVGLLLSMLLRNKLGGRVTTGIFGDTWKVKNLPRSNVLANVETLRGIEGEVGYSTHGYTALKWALKEHEGFDKIVFFTDCQMYGLQRDGHFERLWTKYKQMHRGCKMYLFDLAGYGNTPVRIDEKNVTMISGWSNRVFDMLEALENGSSVLREIDKIDL